MGLLFRQKGDLKMNKKIKITTLFLLASSMYSLSAYSAAGEESSRAELASKYAKRQKQEYAKEEIQSHFSEVDNPTEFSEQIEEFTNDRMKGMYINLITRGLAVEKKSEDRKNFIKQIKSLRVLEMGDRARARTIEAFARIPKDKRDQAVKDARRDGIGSAPNALLHMRATIEMLGYPDSGDYLYTEILKGNK